MPGFRANPTGASLAQQAARQSHNLNQQKSEGREPSSILTWGSFSFSFVGLHLNERKQGIYIQPSLRLKVSWWVDFNKKWKKIFFAVQIEKTDVNIL